MNNIGENKSIISTRCEGIALVGDGLALSGIAKKHKLKDPSVINATIGTLYGEDGIFYRMNNVNKTLKNMNDENFYTYSSADGGADYQNAVINWVLNGKKEELLKEMYVNAIATPGGTGAVNNALFISLDEKETLLLPDLYWAPYKNMVIINKNDIVNYTFIKDGKFNLDGFKEKAEMIVKKQGKLVSILNDPCNNPTGYSLSLKEFEELINFLNSLNCPCTLIYDIAYFDYYVKGMNECRKKFSLMKKANKNVMFNIAFSASKTFSIYGLRLGAEIFLSKDEEAVKAAYGVACCLARTRWSNVNRAGISLLIEIDKNPELKEKIIKDIEKASTITKNRIELFTKEAKEADLDIYPVSGGFFASVKCEDGNVLAEKLKEKKIYVLPFAKAIRIALCSIPLNEIEGLAKRIKDCL